MVIHPYANILVCLCQKTKTSCQTQIHGENFDIEVKGQGYTEFINVHNTLYHGDTLTCQTKYD